MYQQLVSVFCLAALLLAGGCRDSDEVENEVQPVKLQAKEFATGLASPLGLAIDPKGQLWATEVGTGNNDGKVSLITPDGKVYPVVSGFTSVMSPEGLPAGLGHLLYQDGILYILDGIAGKLYLADISSFNAGDKPLSISQLKTEDIRTFVLNHTFEHDKQESNLYNLTFGPEGALYIADAAANAIIRRTSTGELSVFATIPPIQNPTAVGGPTIDGVPTGIVYDGEKFLVTTLTGIPFPTGKARIYQIDKAGRVSLFQDGFTTLIDITLGAHKEPIVLQLGTAAGQGFAPNSGQLIRASAQQIREQGLKLAADTEPKDSKTHYSKTHYVTAPQSRVLLEGLNLPAAIERRDSRTYYVTSLADGKVLKIE